MSDVAAATAAGPAAAQAAPARSFWWKEASGFSFHDLLDVINPLQHLPVIGTIYRWLTGDEPGNVARVIGDGIYGGPIGFGTSLVTVALENKQGQDLGEQALTMLFGPGHGDAATAVAAKAPAPASAAIPGAATAAATPAPAPPPAIPDHAPMPLYGGVAFLPPNARTQQSASGLAATAQNLAASASAAQNPSTTSSPAETRATQEFLARAQAFQRQAVAPAARAGAPPTALVPLVLPPGVLAARPGPNAATIAAAAAAPAAPATTPATPGQPLDISQKMLDALDKYMRLEQQRKAAAPPAPANAVDLTL